MTAATNGHRANRRKKTMNAAINGHSANSKSCVTERLKTDTGGGNENKRDRGYKRSTGKIKTARNRL